MDDVIAYADSRHHLTDSRKLGLMYLKMRTSPSQALVLIQVCPPTQEGNKKLTRCRNSTTLTLGTSNLVRANRTNHHPRNKPHRATAKYELERSKDAIRSITNGTLPNDPKSSC
jgi:hypothetical protein